MSTARLSSFVAALLCSFSLASLAAAAPPAYLRTIGSGQLGLVSGVAIGSDGDVFVLDGYVERFHPDGTFVGSWDPCVGLVRPYQNPEGLESDRNGTIFVSTRGGGYPGHVREFDESGTLIADYTGDGLGNVLGDAWGMGYFSGRLFITTVERLWRLQVGQLTLLPNVQGCGPGEVWSPTSVAVIGNAVFETEYSERLQHLTISGAFVAELGSVAGCGQIRGYPRFVAPDGPGALVVVDMLTNVAQIVTTDGVVLATWGGTGSAHGQFSAAGPAAVGSDGLIYIADAGIHRVEVYSPGPTPARNSSWGAVKISYR